MDKGHKGPHRIENDLKLFHRPLKRTLLLSDLTAEFQRRFSAAQGDYGRRKNPLNTFCFVFFYLFFSSYLLSAERMKRRNYKQMGLLSICCTQVLARHDFKGHSGALKCSLKRDTCFFFFSSPCCNNCSPHWYLTPCLDDRLGFYEHDNQFGSQKSSYPVTRWKKSVTSNDTLLLKICVQLQIMIHCLTWFDSLASSWFTLMH